MTDKTGQKLNPPDMSIGTLGGPGTGGAFKALYLC